MDKYQFYLAALTIFFSLVLQENEAKAQPKDNEIRIISGQVINEKNEPLPFVNIYIEGTTQGVTSNFKGNFTLGIENNILCNLVFQYVGFKKQVVEICSDENSSPLKIILKTESTLLNEVVIYANSEDPAYPIIRQSIKKRKHYYDVINSFSERIYMKSNVTLDEIPASFFLIPKSEMPDSTELGLVYLSESVSKYYFEKPNHQKEEMIASKVAGEKTGYSFNRAQMIMLNFYKNHVNVGVSERSFISPIANNAMFYYKYRLIESFLDNKDLIHKIQVIPKRDHDNIFKGFIYIVENDWNIHSLDLTITRQSQIDFTDSIFIRQVHVPVNDSIRMPLSLHIVMYFKIFGFKASTNFIGFFSEHEVNKGFPEKFFNNEVFRVTEESSTRDSVYWDDNRLAILTEEEIENYFKGDSMLEIRESKTYQDSINRRNNKFKIRKVLWGGGYSNHNVFKHTYYRLNPILKSMINFNLVEGFHLNLRQSFSKTFENSNRLTTNLSTKYSFTNKNFYYQPRIIYYFDRINLQQLRLEGGVNTFQYNEDNPISLFLNTCHTVLFKENFAKFYEKKFLKLAHRREILNGLYVLTSLEYAKRSPLVNNADFTIFKVPDKNFTSNNPLIPSDDSPAFISNKALILSVDITIKFGQKYARYPNDKERYKTTYPILKFGYKKGLNTSISESDFDYWYVRINDGISLANLGVSNVAIEFGGFFNTSRVYFMDFKHFDGNQTALIPQEGDGEITIGGKDNYYTSSKTVSFHSLNYYSNSTIGNYIAFNYYHHFNGWIINKVPFLRKSKIQALAGVNFLYTKEKKEYTEFFIGFEHIFKVMRFDLVSTYYKGQKLVPEFRIGVGF